MKLFRAWYMLPLVISVVSLALRMWSIGQPAQLVSDEVFFVRDGWSYIQRQPYFDPHPPFGKELLGIELAIGGYHPIAWRIGNGILGATEVFLVAWIVWALTKSRSAANFGALIMSLSGLSFVDSRLGLINTPLLVTSLLGVALVLQAGQSRRQNRWLAAAGTAFGLAIATKWLAASWWIPVAVLWSLPEWFPFPRTHRQPGRSWVWWLLVWPLVVYWLVFVGHFLWLHEGQHFWTANLQMLNYHVSVPAAGDPNAQPWRGWWLAWRPFPYWTTTLQTGIAAIRSLPNMWLWWTGGGLTLWLLIRGWRQAHIRFLLPLLLMSWLPYAGIQRVMYSYHAMMCEAILAMLIAVWLGSLWAKQKKLVLAYVLIAVTCFVFFWPWFTGRPLSPSQYRLRQWLPSWTQGT